MIPSEIEIKTLAKRTIYVTLGSKGLRWAIIHEVHTKVYLTIPSQITIYLTAIGFKCVQIRNLRLAFTIFFVIYENIVIK